ncbi:MAG: hypothetical protein IJ225_10555 [Solobacterium sp.]|nr:hypothetical protein [Solobacterium sp.]
MKLKNETYDLLKWMAIYFIPGLTTLIGVIGLALQWQETAIATTICGAVGSFLATCIGMSVSEYEKAKHEQYEGEGD